MRSFIAAWLAGALMALGITLSGMIDPVKVVNFLNLRGHWDPTLLLVMVSAFFTYSVGYWLSRRRQRPLWHERFHLPEKHQIDRPLVLGALLFGVGWGLVGYCPGPALAALGGLQAGTLLFVATMLLGFSLAKRWPLTRRN